MSTFQTRRLTRLEIEQAVRDPKWQAFRVSLLGLPTQIKLIRLDEWVKANDFSEASLVQAVNYQNALRRGGLIK